MKAFLSVLGLALVAVLVSLLFRPARRGRAPASAAKKSADLSPAEREQRAKVARERRKVCADAWKKAGIARKSAPI